jgi:four helix bundle protein
MSSQYKDLVFWQRAYEVTGLVLALSKRLPNDRVANILMNQIVRSSSSVGANIAEGFGRYKGKEYSRFLQIALGSANETDYWLLLIKDTFPQFVKDVEPIIEKNTETVKMLSRSLKTIGDKNLNH